MAEITCFLSLLMGLRSHITCNKGNKYIELYRTILGINIIMQLIPGGTVMLPSHFGYVGGNQCRSGVS